MSKRKRQQRCPDLRLDPEARICPAFDAMSIKKFSLTNSGEIGMQVLDNCGEEHIM